MTELKPWQHGFSLDYLKALAAPFRAALGPYCHGAFGVPKERDVAAALWAGEFFGPDQIIQDDEPLKAAAIAKRLKVASTQHDFAGREFVAPAGSLVISRLGFIDREAARDLIRSLAEARPTTSRTNGFLAPAAAPVWLHIPEESAAHRWIAEDLGFRWHAGKVTAGGDVMGVYVRGNAPPPPDYPPEELSALSILAEGFVSAGERKKILAELAAADKFWADHYSSYNKGKTWTALALRGYDPADPAFIIKPGEMSKKWKAENENRLKARPDWTALAGQMPAVMKVVKRLKPAGYDRVRFMRLAADGGELLRHADITDREAGVADGKIARLHIPIQTSDEARFRGWDLRGREVRLRMPAGALCYLDQRKPHACKNGADRERIHLVVDVASNDWVRGLLRAAAGK